MNKIMNIPYHNENMEGVRQVALKHINKLISEFVKILKYIRDEHMGEEELDVEIKKWEEKKK